MAIVLMLKELILHNKLRFRQAPFGSYALMEILSKLSLIFLSFGAHACSKNKNCRLKANFVDEGVNVRILIHVAKLLAH